MASSLQEYIASKDDSFKWSLDDTEIMANSLHIVQILENGTAIAVSDESFKDGYGTAAWIVKQREDTLYYDDSSRGVNVVPGSSVPGSSEDQWSYQVSLLDCMVSLLSQCVCEYHNITGIIGGMWVDYNGQLLRVSHNLTCRSKPSSPLLALAEFVSGSDAFAGYAAGRAGQADTR